MSPGSYADPRALRFAIADRLRPLAKDRAISLEDLLRQFAYDRLLCRVFAGDSERWILKGATAMLARIGPGARHTRDIDLLSSQGDLPEAETALREAVQLDLEDFFTFSLGAAQTIAGTRQAIRVPVQANLGVRRFATFHVDLVAGLKMTGTPDTCPAIVPVEIPGLVEIKYRIYPLADHIADKVCALHETHERASGLQEPSSRYRDLADLAVFAHTATVNAEQLAAALESEATRRGVALPLSVSVPTEQNWTSGYVRVARDAPLLAERDLTAALQTVRRFIDPILERQAKGGWDHSTLQWDAIESAAL